MALIVSNFKLYNKIIQHKSDRDKMEMDWPERDSGVFGKRNEGWWLLCVVMSRSHKLITLASNTTHKIV
jgi:hypothetical protein